jgi:predicted nucleotidyltransferase component of viral defense system
MRPKSRSSRETPGFPADNLEKVLRQRELLAELDKHTFLQGKLVLKGGTALNLFYLNLKRLSVDIDLNYIAHIEREATQRERPEIAIAGRCESNVAKVCMGIEAAKVDVAEVHQLDGNLRWPSKKRRR